ncbi:MAG: DegV family EDD domain-containing protein [Gammaproteobacteria bacterium]|nr:DegV family EDD domain-containing protein [Gammaproteobacteria bacterium]NNF48752.1 DegV family EDD domain-containing protein [Woeseiaceae bacterium]MBT8094597.1 DegV family EDD domain-containing protein [Gammaproteobacteria bacterium]MBT8106362.1 DegV family EDD domain-containing protein [Gammaproteobacteria bacterium]NNK26377.1 DegV family EDD domain-containing protein [Woeseiaceae bacterium]
MAGHVEKHVAGDTLAAALRSGIHRVLAKQDFLNKINVFPVADSDTGTNMGLSLGAALPVLNRPGEKHLGTMLAAIADALLDGSRGNSGAIVAQFFQGLSDAAGEITRFTTYTFAKAVSLGNEYAHDALSKPREGTILSVIAAFARSISQQLKSDPDAAFHAVLARARDHVETALADTPNQLDVLKKAGVVDAGAAGFAELVAGMAEYFADGTEAPLPNASLAKSVEAVVEFSEADNVSQYRYCTECMVTGHDINRRKLREALAEIGDSIVLAGSKRKAKIHVHVDDPETVFETARRFGELSKEKADDMHRQQHATHDGKRKFAVVVDSGADISEADMERLDIHMVPTRIQFGDHGYLDKLSITIDEFYEELANNPHHPTTSQPAPGDFRRTFQFLASHFEDVISVNLTSAASGTYEAARLAASRVDAPGKIHVVDTRNASLAQGQLAVLAAECAAAGVDAQTTLAAVESQVPTAATFAILSNLRYAVRGGRLPAWVRTIAEALGLTPVICTTREGKISLSGTLFGKKRRIERFARHVARRAPLGPVEIGVGHAVCEADALELEKHLKARIPDIRRIGVLGLSPAIGVHGGPGTLLVAIRPWLSAQDVANRAD